MYMGLVVGPVDARKTCVILASIQTPITIRRAFHSKTLYCIVFVVCPFLNTGKIKG